MPLVLLSPSLELLASREHLEKDTIDQKALAI